MDENAKKADTGDGFQNDKGNGMMPAKSKIWEKFSPSVKSLLIERHRPVVQYGPRVLASPQVSNPNPLTYTLSPSLWSLRENPIAIWPSRKHARAPS